MRATGVDNPVTVVSTDAAILSATTSPSSVTPYDAAAGWYRVSNRALSPLSNRASSFQFLPLHASLAFCGCQCFSSARVVAARLAANANTICLMVLSFSLVPMSRFVTNFQMQVRRESNHFHLKTTVAVTGKWSDV